VPLRSTRRRNLSKAATASKPQPAPKAAQKDHPGSAPAEAAARYRPVAGTVEIRHEAAALILEFSQDDWSHVRVHRPWPAGAKKAVNKRIELSVVTETHKDSSPNVIAVLEGSDPVLKSEYVVNTAHHDHLACAMGNP